MKVSSLDLVFERILPFFTLVRLRYFRGFSGEGLDNFYHYEISSRFFEVHRARKTLSPKSHQRWYSPNYINTSSRQKVGIINKMMTKKKNAYLRVNVSTNIEKHIPRVMTSLLMSSPPFSISHRLFRCRYSNSRDIVASSPSFSHPAARKVQRACSQTMHGDKCWKFVCGYWDSKSQQRSRLKACH